MNADELYLRKFEDNDMDLFRHWLYKDYILKWYKDADEWVNELKQRNGDFKFINHYIVMLGDEAIGFCQYHDCYCAKEDWYSVQKSNTLFSIDYLIGEEKYLNKGYGKKLYFY
jgi:RimJ/RimL family protein N-acetyltransferase